jgi:hypothetical protein
MPTTVSPTDGEVTTWRMQGASAAPGYYIEVLRPDAEGELTVTAASAMVEPTGPGLQTFTTSLPISAGEYIGLITPNGADIPLLEQLSTATIFNPAPVGAKVNIIQAGAEFPLLAFNADIVEPKVEPEKEVVTKTVPGPTVTKVIEVPAKTGPQCKVPRVAGKRLLVAKKELKESGCKVGFVIRPRGVKATKAKVRKTLPKPGTELPLGTPVSLKLG